MFWCSRRLCKGLDGLRRSGTKRSSRGTFGWGDLPGACRCAGVRAAESVPNAKSPSSLEPDKGLPGPRVHAVCARILRRVGAAVLPRATAIAVCATTSTCWCIPGLGTGLAHPEAHSACVDRLRKFLSAVWCDRAFPLRVVGDASKSRNPSNSGSNTAIPGPRLLCSGPNIHRTFVPAGRFGPRRRCAERLLPRNSRCSHNRGPDSECPCRGKSLRGLQRTVAQRTSPCRRAADMGKRTSGQHRGLLALVRGKEFRAVTVGAETDYHIRRRRRFHGVARCFRH